jgi:hypothetical protein
MQSKKVKGRQGKSCAAICCTINNSSGSQEKDQTVWDYVQKWLIGVLPKKWGRVGSIPHEQFNMMVVAGITEFLYLSLLSLVHTFPFIV